MAVPEVEMTIRTLRMGRTRFLLGLEKVPEERLDWTPAPNVRSPLGVAQTMASYLFFLDYAVRNLDFPAQEVRPKPPSDRHELARNIDGGFDRLIATLQGLDASDLDRELPAPWGGTMTLRLFVGFFAVVVGYWQGQMNYVQLAYGDTASNIPENWGADAEG